jgi:tRNA(Ile)-lysidine synthase
MPLGEADFALSMSTFEPFETEPLVAVAVSGGGDSLALCLLADAWSQAHGGRVIALTVDHGLRPDSGDEARQVADWVSALGIEHHILRWTGAKPATRLQQAAREARYQLLRSWCGVRGVLHLLVAHTLEDQAETVLLRREAGSGSHGLAGMSACVETAETRILRPLLGVPRARLRATLEAAGQDWIEDPSNRDARFARVRMRQALLGRPEEVVAVCGKARRHGMARRSSEAALSGVAGRWVSLASQGHAIVTVHPLGGVPTELRTRFWGGVLAAIGGRAFAPDAAATASLADWLQADGAAGSRTLGGCRLSIRDGVALVVREARNLPPPRRLRAGERLHWDGRFRIEVGEGAAVGAYLLGPLGSDGLAEVGGRVAAPRSAVVTLPAVRDENGVVEVPGIGYLRTPLQNAGAVLSGAVFSPGNAVTGMGFLLA